MGHPEKLRCITSGHTRIPELDSQRAGGLLRLPLQFVGTFAFTPDLRSTLRDAPNPVDPDVHNDVEGTDGLPRHQVCHLRYRRFHRRHGPGLSHLPQAGNFYLPPLPLSVNDSFHSRAHADSSMIFLICR